MKTLLFSKWDESVFKKVLEFKASLQSEIPTFFSETLEDYKKFFGELSPFLEDYNWQGFLIQREGEIIAQAILCWRKDSMTGNLGFIDWVNDEVVALKLAKEVENFSKEVGLKNLRAPVDMNFFVKYRMKCQGGGDPFYGEPIYPDYYQRLFEVCGYQVVGEWETLEADVWRTILSYIRKRKELKERKHVHNQALKVRSIRLSKWSEEIRTVYDLFVKSFANMPEFEPITFEQFQVVYDDFKYIIHPWYAYIIELKGFPVGFAINYPDPLPVLGKVRKTKLSTIGRLKLLLKLKLNYKTLLMSYVGKIPGPDGEEIKGVPIKVSRKLSSRCFFFQKALYCYVASDSPSRRGIDANKMKPYSKYVLFGKNLG